MWDLFYNSIFSRRPLCCSIRPKSLIPSRNGSIKRYSQKDYYYGEKKFIYLFMTTYDYIFN